VDFVTFKDLMRLSHGFQAARVFLSAVELDLFTALQNGGTVSQLAEQRHLSPRPLTLTLNALVAMGLLHHENGMYRNAPIVEENLVMGKGGYRGHIFRHISHCWPAWSSLSDVLAGKEQAPERDSLGQGDVRNRDFILGMENVTRELAPYVVDTLALENPAVLLDVGGGPGTYAEAFLRRYPSLKEVRVFDLPETVALGKENLGDRGQQAPIRWIAGDFFRDSLGSGTDIVWMSQVFHSLDEAGCRMLIGKAFDALNRNGELIVHEFLLDDDRTGPLRPALFAVHMLVLTGVGRTYSGGELGRWMEEAGFTRVRVEKVSDDTSVVRGIKS